MDIEIDVPNTISALFVQAFPGRQRNRLSLFGYISVWVEDIKEKKDWFEGPSFLFIPFVCARILGLFSKV